MMSQDLLIAKTLRVKAPWLHRSLSPEQMSTVLRAFHVLEYRKGDVVASYKVGQEGCDSCDEKEEEDREDREDREDEGMKSVQNKDGEKDREDEGMKSVVQNKGGRQEKGGRQQKGRQENHMLNVPSSISTTSSNPFKEKDSKGSNCFHILEQGNVICSRSLNSTKSLFYPHGNDAILCPEQYDHFGESVILGGNDQTVSANGTWMDHWPTTTTTATTATATTATTTAAAATRDSNGLGML